MLENNLTLVDEKYVALLQDAESQAAANLPAGAEEPAVSIRTLSPTLYALLATLTTGRSLRLVQRVPDRNGVEAWRQLVAENAPKTAGRRFAMLQAVLQPGMSDNPAKFEETWKSWEYQVDVQEHLSSSKLDDDVKSSVVLREAPQELGDHLLVNSQQFESNYNKLRAIIQAYLNTNKTWIANDLKETDPMEVDYTGKSKGEGKNKSKSKGKSKGERRQQRQRQGQEHRQEQRPQSMQRQKQQQRQRQRKTLTTTESATCAERRVISHEIVGHEPTTTRW